MNYVLTTAILICWPTSVVLFFIGIFIALPWKGSYDLMQNINTWPQFFNAIRGEYGLRARIYGIVYFLSLVTGIIGMGSFFIGGIFCT